MSEKVTFEEIKRLTNDKNVLLIDVREKNEILNTGIIPGSINIPLGNLEQALNKCPQDQFRNYYGCNKPSKDLQLVFYCRSGRRALDAQKLARNLGYKNVRYYPGSWEEWASKNNLRT